MGNGVKMGKLSRRLSKTLTKQMRMVRSLFMGRKPLSHAPSGQSESTNHGSPVSTSGVSSTCAPSTGRTAAGMESLLSENPRYRPIKLLGSGAYGHVLLAEDRHKGNYVAVKLIRRGEKITKRVEREVLNHKILKHNNIVQFQEVFLTSMHLCIVMEYAAGGTLLQYVDKRGSLSEREARRFFHQLILAVHYCHELGVVNRDIKLDNTLLDSNDPPNVKICDFGYSKHLFVQSDPASRVGTPQYLAPEVILAKGGLPYNAKTADVWSCGVSLYAMLTGKYPFDKRENANNIVAKDRKLKNLLQRIVDCEYKCPKGELSEDACDLIEKMLVFEPKKRIKLQEIKNHPWFQVGLAPEFEEQWASTVKEPLAQEERATIHSMVEDAKESKVQSFDLDMMITDAMQQEARA